MHLKIDGKVFKSHAGYADFDRIERFQNFIMVYFKGVPEDCVEVSDGQLVEIEGGELAIARSQDDHMNELRAVAEIVFVQMAQTEQLDPTTIAEHPALFVKWSSDWTGKVGTILQDNGGLYRSLHDVGKGQNTKPSETPSMWAKIADPDEEWTTWSQPYGAHDAYDLNAKVSHNGKHWICTQVANGYAPGVHGWKEVK